MPISKKIKLSDKFEPARILAPKREPMTKIKFIMAVLQGTAAVMAFILIFSIYAAILFLGRIKKLDAVRAPHQNNSIVGEILYRNDKIFYQTDEIIKLDIVNNSNESIYLAPCQYFNKFEKKLSDKWQALFFGSCDNSDFEINAASIEKISKKIDESIPAKKLGKGVWRGVSAIYFGCEKAQAASCKNNKIIYTNEFTIGGKEALKAPSFSSDQANRIRYPKLINEPEFADSYNPQL